MDILAPEGEIESTSGTSQAASKVAGAILLMQQFHWSLDRQHVAPSRRWPGIVVGRELGTERIRTLNGAISASRVPLGKVRELLLTTLRTGA